MIADRSRFERVLRRHGCTRIAGVDEAGRGALAGPLVAAAVVLPDGFDLTGIRDSKQLTPRQRKKTFERIEPLVDYAVCWADPETIDRLGVHACNLELLGRAAHQLDPEPGFVLIDGAVAVPGIGFASRTVKHGDQRCASIAAASIVAKVTRDRLMDELHRDHPDYGFDHNRGYGPDQWKPIHRFGPIPGVHRFSIKGMRGGASPV